MYDDPEYDMRKLERTLRSSRANKLAVCRTHLPVTLLTPITCLAVSLIPRTRFEQRTTSKREKQTVPRCTKADRN